MTTHRLVLATPATAARLLRVVITILLLTAAASAQTAVDSGTPAGLAPGSPAGSYALSGFETVSLFNGSLNFRLPLLKVGGRGSAGYSVTLPVEQKWVVKSGQPSPSGYVPMTPNPNWWQGIRPGYGPGVMHGRRGNHEDGRGEETYGCGGVGEGCTTVLREIYLRTLTRLTFTTSDGTEYELRDRKTDGTPHADSWLPSTGNRDGFPRGRVFATSDGTSATFLSDAEIKDYVAPNLALTQRLFYPSGYLLLADGTRHRIDSGTVSWIQDRNGNRVAFSYGAGSRVASATDQLGRQVTFTYDDGVRHYDEISFKGFGGVERTIRIRYDYLANLLRPDSGYSLRTYHQLFPLNSASTQTQYNPSNKVSEVELPDGRRYRLYYNPYGELARVELPTGGAVEYEWSGGADPGDGTIFRYATKRRVYPNVGAAWESETEYLRVGNGGTSSVEEKTTDQSGALLARAIHYFHGDAVESLVPDPARPSAISYSKWREGREYRTEAYDVVGGAPVLKRVVEQTWRQPAAGQTWPLSGQGEADEGARPNSPQVTESVVKLSDTGQESKQAFSYDRYGNQTDVYEYGYGAGAPGPLMRHTHTDYLTTNTIGVVTHDYACDPSTTCSETSISPNVIHLRGVPRAQQVYGTDPLTGAETLAAKSETRYDEDSYGLLPCDPQGVVACASVPQWVEPGTAARGNATTSRRWLDTINGWVETHAQYDRLGNVRHSWDARGNRSEVSYGDSFCNGSACGGTYTPNTFAFPTSSKTPKPDPTGEYGLASELSTSTVYDFHTGLAYSATDANNQTTLFSYEDQPGRLDRPKAVVRPDGGRTDYEYGDTPGGLYVRVLTDLDAGRRTETKQYFDGLGRAYRSLTYENSDASKPWVTVDTEYDALGRVKRASMPYRAADGAPLFSTGRWAESTYDALGRVLAAKTMPDAATVHTAYRGSLVQVTDQAGKSRRSETDALGRLTGVVEFTRTLSNPSAVEDPLAADYVTGYRYDALGNLRKVDQGGQLRFFMYDSLGRLIRAKNPEQGGLAADADFPALTDSTSGVANGQWSVGYAYDPNSNLLKRKDARNVTTTYAYDALNRNTAVAYAGEAGAATPGVSRHYDGAPGGKGRPWKTETAQVSLTTVELYDAAGRPKKQRQEFRAGTSWGEDFRTEVAYNLAGGVTSITYPSTNKAEYRYDAAGRLADHGGQPAFSGTLGDGVQRTYASQVLYDELGGMSQERFGTDTPVYNKHFYNSRGQLSDIRVGTHPITEADPTLRTNWNRGAILNHYSQAVWGGSDSQNNGNLITQQVWVPNGEDPNRDGFALFEQSYAYDHLNRLKSVREGNSWQQIYNYDRWGNRTIDAAGTWDTSQTNWQVNEAQFTVDQGTNRLDVPAGQSGQMTYDAAGNLTHDTYRGGEGGGGTRAYDAENRMTSAQFLSGQTQTAHYTYDADGRRVKRNGGGGEVWQVYGMGGELLAEYAAEAHFTQPQKEYGYRGGELLVTAEAGSESETVWVDDSVPQGSTAGGNSEGWAWASTNPAPASGASAHQSAAVAGFHQHYFSGASSTLAVSAGDVLFAYVYLDPQDPPTQVMLQWNDGSWEHRAFWGADQIAVGTPGTESRRHMGALPAAGGWVRLEVAASQVGLEGRALNGMAFTLYGGRAAWDRAGRAASSAPQGAVSSAAPDFSASQNPAGRWAYGYRAAGGAFTPFAAAGQVFGAGAQTWWGGGAQNCPMVTKGTAGAAYQYPLAPTVVQPPDTLNLHPGPNGERGVVRWTAPEAGTYAVEGRFEGIDTGGTTSDVQVTHNGTQVFTGHVNGYGAQATFSLVRTLAAGEAIEFSVGVGSNGTYNNDSTGLSATVTRQGGGGAAARINWLVTDQLGTPRMVLDRAGSLSGVTRHDYLPFGEELFTGVGGRTTNQGYNLTDGVRQKYAGSEHDSETGLDYMQARYYGSTVGRFTSVDPVALTADRLLDPQQLNLYAYTRNNPLRFIDPNGEDLRVTTKGGKELFVLDDGKREVTNIIAADLYKRGVQWFEPEADNYMALKSVAKGIEGFSELKHFSWDQIASFAEQDRSMFSYRQGGSGDWKSSKEGADGYLLVTVGGKPYWADAIGQIPFAVDYFTDRLESHGDELKAGAETIQKGREYSEGKLIGGKTDTSNTYDNYFVLRGAMWASYRYEASPGIVYGYNAVRSGENHPPVRLADPIGRQQAERWLGKR